MDEQAERAVFEGFIRANAISTEYATLVLQRSEHSGEYSTTWVAASWEGWKGRAQLAAAPVAAQEPDFSVGVDSTAEGVHVTVIAGNTVVYSQLHTASQPAQGDAITEYYTDRNRGGWAYPRDEQKPAQIAEPVAVQEPTVATWDNLPDAKPAQGERVTVCPTLDRECGEYYGGWCATCPKARTKAQGERQPVAWRYVLDNTEGIKSNKPMVVLSASKHNPFGEAGVDYSKSYPVICTPLYE